MLSHLQANEIKKRLLDEFSKPEYDDRRVSVGIELPPEDADEDAYKIAIRVASDDERAQVSEKLNQIGIPEDDVSYRVVGFVAARVPAPAAGQPAVPAGPLAIGMTVSRVDYGPGTLGFFAERGGRRGFVSCNHVIARGDRFQIDDVIVCPAAAFGGTPENHLAGRLKRVARLKDGSRAIKRADAAFAEIAEHRWPEQPGSLGVDGFLSDNLARIVRGVRVAKLGGTTQRTEGRISACWIDRFLVDYDGVTVRLDDVIEITPTLRDPATGEILSFADGGDSGSLVFRRFGGERKEPVGILFTETAIGGPDNAGLAYANPIGKVMHALRVKLVV